MNDGMKATSFSSTLLPFPLFFFFNSCTIFCQSYPFSHLNRLGIPIGIRARRFDGQKHIFRHLWSRCHGWWGWCSSRTPAKQVDDLGESISALETQQTHLHKSIDTLNSSNTAFQNNMTSQFAAFQSLLLDELRLLKSGPPFSQTTTHTATHHTTNFSSTTHPSSSKSDPFHP